MSHWWDCNTWFAVSLVNVSNKWEKVPVLISTWWFSVTLSNLAQPCNLLVLSSLMVPLENRGRLSNQDHTTETLSVCYPCRTFSSALDQCCWKNTRMRPFVGSPNDSLSLLFGFCCVYINAFNCDCYACWYYHILYINPPGSCQHHQVAEVAWFQLYGFFFLP